MMEMPRSREPESTRLMIKARAKNGAVNLINEIGRPRINRKIGASWDDKWMHQDSTIEIGRAKKS